MPLKMVIKGLFVDTAKSTEICPLITVSTSTRVVAILIAIRADVYGTYKIAHVKIFFNSAADSKIKPSKFNLSRVLRKFLLRK